MEVFGNVPGEASGNMSERSPDHVPGEASGNMILEGRRGPFQRAIESACVIDFPKLYALLLMIVIGTSRALFPLEPTVVTLVVRSGRC